MKSNIGQLETLWSGFWEALSPEDEIGMWDFYGGRPWVLRYAPRYGRLLEAGCGLGRYVFLLERMGVEIDGLDFQASTIKRVSAWAVGHDFASRFIVGDVMGLPYKENTLSCYLSFGVIEHFQGGPALALAEAKRVLRPGGIAIVSTPALSFSQIIIRLGRRVKNTLKRLSGQSIQPKPFFQYWWQMSQLRAHIVSSGLWVSVSGTCDIKYAFWELGVFGKAHKYAFRIADWMETTPLVRLGAQNFTVSVKLAPVMDCFLCGQSRALQGSLITWTVPVCDECSRSPLALYYIRGSANPHFHAPWAYDSPRLPEIRAQDCHFCGKHFVGERLFDGHYGFSVPICQECLRNPAVNLVAANEYLRPIWRPRQADS